MYRPFAIGVLLLWVSAMAALFARDVWPAWTAQDPPPVTIEQFTQLDQRERQFGISRSSGERIGTSWSKVSRTGPSTTISGTILLDGLPYIPVVVVTTNTLFDEQGGLDSFRLDIHGVPMTRIHIRGERRGIYFPCELHLGTIHQQVNLDLAASRLIGESLRPFSFLPTLEVGQSWRMQLLDPLSAAMGGGANFTSVVARVTGMETIEHPEGSGEWVECFVVETSPQRSKAWVDRAGEVLVQQVDMPGLGPITVREEPFNETRRNVAGRQLRRRIGTGGPAAADPPDETVE